MTGILHLSRDTCISYTYSYSCSSARTGHWTSVVALILSMTGGAVASRAHEPTADGDAHGSFYSLYSCKG